MTHSNRSGVGLLSFITIANASKIKVRKSMIRNALLGLLAGAAGTVSLNVATYVDMALRGRSSSEAPSKLVSTIADKTKLPLSPQGVGSNDQTAQNRESGLG